MASSFMSDQQLAAIRRFGAPVPDGDPSCCNGCGRLVAWRDEPDEDGDICDECVAQKAEFADELLAEVDRLRAERVVLVAVFEAVDSYAFRVMVDAIRRAQEAMGRTRDEAKP